MTYTIEQAEANFSQLVKEAEEGKEVLIARGEKPAIRLVVAEGAPELKGPVLGKRIAGQYAGHFEYPDDFFKPLETDEELREYGFDILVGAEVLEDDDRTKARQS
jgi:antitoxin (DNA-binding transcriptional repressor) of toxin-antitoxin stability system